MDKEQIKSIGGVVLMVIAEAAVSIVVGGSGSYEAPSTLAGVVLFIGLEAMRHWRLHLKHK